MTIAITSHVLDATDGTHVAGVAVHVNDADGRQLVQGRTDDGGRIILEFPAPVDTDENQFALVVRAGAHFCRKGQDSGTASPFEVITICFRMHAGQHNIHIPVIIAPNSYTAWCSSA